MSAQIPRVARFERVSRAQFEADWKDAFPNAIAPCDALKCPRRATAGAAGYDFYAPAAFALDFMNRLFPWFIGKDRNYLITTDLHNNYSIVCHNQQILNYNYFLTSETAIEKENTWKYFEERKNLKLHLTMRNVKEGKYRVKVYRINNRHGSVLDTWEEMGYENELSRNDIKYLRRICEPYLTIRTTQTQEDRIEIEEELQPNEICLIRLRYVGE